MGKGEAVVASLVEEPSGKGPAAIAAAVAAAIADDTSTLDLDATFGSGSAPIAVPDAFLEALPAVNELVAADESSRAITLLRGRTVVAQCGGGEHIDIRFVTATHDVIY